jgi:hypothetical protein
MKKRKQRTLSDITPQDIIESLLRFEAMGILELDRDEQGELVFTPKGEMGMKPTALFDRPDLWNAPDVDAVRFKHDVAMWKEKGK